jgi:membrane-associated phospholipid phosphatase
MRPSERLTAAFLVALALLAAAGRPPGALELIGTFLAVAAVVVLAARANPVDPARALARDFLPVAIVVAVFLLLEPVIAAVNPTRWDPFFATVDARFLGAVLVGWRGFLGRPDRFTDLVYAAYASYYLLPIVVAVAVRASRPAAFEATVFAILLCLYLSFAGYVLFPTLGPRVPSEAEGSLGGGAVAHAVRAFLRAAERTRLDAFPSGHTAVALVCAAAGARVLRRTAVPLFAWAAAIVFSTVYIQVHYVVDVLAGALLAVLTLAVAPAVARALAGRGGTAALAG